jgi:uncharacterized membrane protein
MLAAPGPALNRRLTAVITMAAALLALSVAPVAASSHSSMGAANRCYGVQGSGTTSFDPAVGGFSGTATFRLGGQSQQVQAAAFVTGPASTSHVLAFEQGTIVTDDLLILKPIDPAAGLFELRTRLQVVEGGTGKLRLLPGSTLDLAGGAAAWEMRGHLCFD